MIGDFMEFTTQQELFKALAPVFKVKIRLISITEYDYISKDDIFRYLSTNKWLYDKGLTLAEVVNDIINVDISKVANYMGGIK